MAEFLATAPVRQAIFDLARRLSFFEKPLPEAARRTAGQRSLKTLAYHFADAHHSFSYHRAETPAVLKLTALFEKMSAALEFGRRLEYLQHYNKEELGPELRLMSSAAQNGRLLEMQAIAPTLRDISRDDTVAPAVREQAKQLLTKYGSTAGPSQG